MRFNEITKNVLNEMLNIFYSEDAKYVDWMGYPLTNSNKPTYHHIEKAEELRNNTPKRNKYKPVDVSSLPDIPTVENGAILGKKSHEKLNRLETLDPELFEAWNYIFLVINRMRIYPIDDVWKMVYALKLRTEEVLYNQNKDKAKSLELKNHK